MKKLEATFITIIVILSCNKNKTLEEAKILQSAIEVKSNNETISNEYFIMAKINGKDWHSNSMGEAQTSGRIAGSYNEQYIGLPYNDQYLVVGKKITLNEEEAADIFLKDGCSYPIANGEMEITKLGSGFAEGKFFFTTVCNSTKKTLNVTDGFFRIQISKE